MRRVMQLSCDDYECTPTNRLTVGMSKPQAGGSERHKGSCWACTEFLQCTKPVEHEYVVGEQAVSKQAADTM